MDVEIFKNPPAAHCKQTTKLSMHIEPSDVPVFRRMVIS